MAPLAEYVFAPMNVLAPLMQDHPEVVDFLARTKERVQFESLGQALRQLELPFAPTPPGIDDAIASNPELEGPLREAYLPVVPLEHWREAIEQAEPIHPISEPDWVVYAAAKESPTGVTLPQDSDPMLRVSLFTRIEGRTGRVSIDYANGAGPPPTGLSAAVNACSLPDWGRCEQDGACEGKCQAGRAFGPERMVCRCTLG